MGASVLRTWVMSLGFSWLAVFSSKERPRSKAPSPVAGTMSWSSTSPVWRSVARVFSVSRSWAA